MTGKLDVQLSEVTSNDIAALVDLNDQALVGDPYVTWIARYTDRNETNHAVNALTAALTDAKTTVIKATITQDGQEVIVGFVQWENGYIELVKVNPFAKPDVRDVTQTPEQLEKAAKTTADPDKARRLERGEARYVHSRNIYIGAIRGKKHNFVRRLMVHPSYQGMGVGGKLLRLVTRQADEQKIVCWLFSRPSGEPLYLKAGFESKGATEMDEPEDGLVCPRTLAMMRPPQPL